MTNAHCALKENAMKLKLSLIAAGVLAATSMLATTAQAAPAFADVITIVDESGSMSGEHAWLGGMIGSLDTGLNTAGLTPNQYGLVGFGGASTHLSGHQHDVGGAGSQFGTAAQYATATGTLVLNGGTEDGYSGINAANGYTFRAGAARNYILVTDEDRDNTNGALTYANILASLTGANTLLNAVVNATFRCGDSSVALGIASGGKGYKADGVGGFTTCTGATAVSGSGSTIGDYVNLALATGGGAWNLNFLRAGGVGATSFTNAFIALKVEEITSQVPLPGTLALLGIGLVGLGAVRRKQAAVAA
jgi:hypothetical protein